MPGTTDAVFTEKEAVRLVAEEYGIETHAGRLPGYSTTNFRLEAADGQRFVLKLAGAGSDLAVLDLENQALDRLAARDLSFSLPRLVPTADGRPIVSLPDGGSARLLRWLPGRLWAELGGSPARRESLGRSLAELDRGLLDLKHPAARRKHDWDLRRAGHQQRYVSAIPDAARRRLADRALQRFSAYTTLHGGELRRSVIHGDANDHNLLMEGERVTGILDFGDIVESWTVCEVAIATAYATLDASEPLSAACQVAAAYHSGLPLTEPELSVLFPLITARLAQSAVLAARRRLEGADDAYIFVSEEPVWSALEALSGVAPEAARRHLRSACSLPAAPPAARKADLLAARRRHVGPSLSLAYAEPLHLARGFRQYLFDTDGRPYLDLVNNVCHVGHCHPRVVEAAGRQMRTLNTNTRYLYDSLSAYAERLTATLPDDLQVCFFVNSGSEANELAIRIARAATGRRDLLVLEGAYHGHTTGLIEASPYKFRGRGGSGRAADWIHLAPMPDGYRGPHRGRGAATGRRYAEEVEGTIAGSPRPIAAFLSEPILGCGGQIVPPPGFLAGAYRAIRAAGGLAIADEVQVGFGRVGSHFWAFETQGVVPDIVVLGKPIGNGHPMAAVITTREIADAFDNGMEFFSTFGGNPVSCAIGMAVLDVLEKEGLQRRAAELGGLLQRGLQGLARKSPWIGDVRCAGLFAGVEMVRDRETREPATATARLLVDRLAGDGLLLSTDGPYGNVLKLKPPMVLEAGDLDFFLRALERELDRLPDRAPAAGN